MWVASLEKAKQHTSASARHWAFNCRCWEFSCSSPAVPVRMCLFEVASVVAASALGLIEVQSHAPGSFQTDQTYASAGGGKNLKGVYVLFFCCAQHAGPDPRRAAWHWHRDSAQATAGTPAATSDLDVNDPNPNYPPQ
jgi:hypothetical protein